VNQITETVKYIAMWSGGKDSTYMILKLFEKNFPLDEVIFCDTGWEFPQMYSYILKVEDYIRTRFKFTNFVKLNWQKGKEIWNKWAEGEFKKGQYKGKKRGFPFSFGKSWCVRELKVNPVKKYIQQKFSKATKIYLYIGIAYDENKRISKSKMLKDIEYLYPLVDWQVKEDKTNTYLKQLGLYNSLYDYFDRLGCFLCPRQSLKRLFILYKYFPELWREVYQLGKKYKERGCAVYKIKGYDVDELEKMFKDKIKKEQCNGTNNSN